MAKVKFYLEKRKNKEGQLRITDVPIYLYFSFNGKRFQYYTGERTDFKSWDSKKQKVKSNSPNAFEINFQLEQLAEKAQKFYREKKLHGIVPTIEDFKQVFKNDSQKNNSQSIFECFQEYIESKKVKASYNSIKKYQTNLNYLKDFASLKKYSIEFDSIDDHFLNKYINYFIYDLDHTNNTISRNIRILKTFLSWATKRGYNKNLAYSNFSFHGFNGEIIALSIDEVMKLYQLPLDSGKLIKVRDIFCFCCFTGLRYSDVKNLKKEDIRGDFIRSFSIKTKDQLCVPLNHLAKAVLDKYSSYPMEDCLPVMSNQKMNDYLKEIGKLAGIDEKINIVQFQGANRVENTYHKYELLTTHVARKTFVTHAHRKGIPTETIMKITNHKSHASVSRYLKIEEDVVLQAMKNIF